RVRLARFASARAPPTWAHSSIGSTTPSAYDGTTHGKAHPRPRLRSDRVAFRASWISRGRYSGGQTRTDASRALCFRSPDSLPVCCCLTVTSITGPMSLRDVLDRPSIADRDSRFFGGRDGVSAADAGRGSRVRALSLRVRDVWQRARGHSQFRLGVPRAVPRHPRSRAAKARDSL